MSIRVSTKGRYGLRLMIDLALHGGGEIVRLREIAERQEISGKYLWQVINPLKNAGLVTVTRGAHGGFALARPAEKITVYDIVAPLEGPMSLVACVRRKDECNRAAACAAREVWTAVDRALEKALRGITLAAIVRRLRDTPDSNYVI
jgi:Rrf2 family protein